mmetsp:Transcript_35006/g.99958  ORF Transcript_35006/g.99958 Transcript_35006/m.99958 type:complete len:226 (-) Transcript_35006:638-1315(-)
MFHVDGPVAIGHLDCAGVVVEVVLGEIPSRDAACIVCIAVSVSVNARHGTNISPHIWPRRPRASLADKTSSRALPGQPEVHQRLAVDRPPHLSEHGPAPRDVAVGGCILKVRPLTEGQAGLQKGRVQEGSVCKHFLLTLARGICHAQQQRLQRAGEAMNDPVTHLDERHLQAGEHVAQGVHEVCAPGCRGAFRSVQPILGVKPKLETGHGHLELQRCRGPIWPTG